MWGFLTAYRAPVPVDTEDVRSTVDPVRNDAPAMEQGAPESSDNVHDVDSSGQLKGLARRQLGSYTVPSKQGMIDWSVLATADHATQINEQIATAGVAPAIEATGRWGHGTMGYQVGIEPTIQGHRMFGEDMFVSNERDVQTGARDEMAPTVSGSQEAAEAASLQAGDNARAARAASMYDALFTTDY